MFLIILQYLLLASTFTIGKAALDYAQPIFFVGVRMLLGGSLLLVYQYFFNRKQWRLDKQDILIFVKMMFFHIAISFGCEFWALQYVSAAKVGLLWNLAPFVTALFAYHYFDEQMTLKKWIGLCIGFIGLLPSLITSAPNEATSCLSFAELVLFIAIVSGSYAWILMKELVTDKNYSPIMVNGVAMIGGGIIDLLASLIIESPPYITAVPRFGAHCQPFLARHLCDVLSFEYAGVALFVIYLVALVLIANVVCFNLYAYLLRFYSTTFVSFCGFSTPLFAALFDWLFRGEVVGMSFFLSVAIVSIGLYIFYQEELNVPESV